MCEVVGLNQFLSRVSYMGSISAEEVLFMDLLKYVYSNDLPITCNALIDLLVIAEKFEVEPCLRDCSGSLQKLPMTLESASLYLDLPPILLMSPAIHPLIDMAKNFLLQHFKDFNWIKQEDILGLSLPCIQAVLTNDDLQVSSEDVVCRFILRWLSKHYPINESERREIFGTHLLNLVRFPFMSTTLLVDSILTCSNIDHEVASEMVIHALCFKAETLDRRRWLTFKESHRYRERAYTIRPVKLIELEDMPHPQSIVYIQFTREELMHTFPRGEIRSEIFHLGEHQLELIVACDIASGKPTDKYYFWVMLEVKGELAAVDYEIALRTKHSKRFKRWFKRWIEGSQAFSEDDYTGSCTTYLYRVPWTDFIADESTHFIDGIFHLRADLTINYD